MRTSSDREFDTLREKVETLTGERAGGARRALRVADLDAIRKLRIPTISSSYAAANPPTKAEYDRLVDDVKALRTAMDRLVASIALSD